MWISYFRGLGELRTMSWPLGLSLAGFELIDGPERCRQRLPGNGWIMPDPTFEARIGDVPLGWGRHDES